MVRSRGLEPPRVAPLAPQASASTNSATTAVGGKAARGGAAQARCNKSTTGEQGLPAGPSWPAPAHRIGTLPAGSAHIFKPLRQPLDLDRDAIAADDDRAPRHREIVGQDRDLVILGGIELDDGAAAEPEHLVDWHICGAKHHLDIERDFVECGHRILRADVTVGPDHAMVSRWLTCATDWTSGSGPSLSLPRWNGAWASGLSPMTRRSPPWSSARARSRLARPPSSPG